MIRARALRPRRKTTLLVFKRRDPRPWWRIIKEALWPRGGWGRAAQYIKHRLRRLPDSPHKISRGILAGVLTTFTPFYGLHFVFAAIIARLIQGNILAALLATFFGNPLTYVPIGIISLNTGYFLLGIQTDDMKVDEGLIAKFSGAGKDLFGNLWAYVTGAPRDWSHLAVFWQDVFWPYTVGGIIPGIIAGIICYYISLPLITAYQNRRRGRLKERLSALKRPLGKKENKDVGSS